MQVAATLTIDQEGIGYQWFEGSGKARNLDRVSWDSITKLEVFKRDMFCYDLICLAVTSASGVVVEVDEEDLNWDLLISSISQYLEEVTPWESWFSDVAFPAFTENMTAIYERTDLEDNKSLVSKASAS